MPEGAKDVKNYEKIALAWIYFLSLTALYEYYIHYNYQAIIDNRYYKKHFGKVLRRDQIHTLEIFRLNKESDRLLFIG